jgi:hypothetical protein
MQLVHALKLGDDTRLDRAANAWMRGRLTGRDATYLRRKEEERQYLNRSKLKPSPAKIGKPSVREDDKLLALLKAIDKMQEVNNTLH